MVGARRLCTLLCPSIGWSVGPSKITFLTFCKLLVVFALLLLSKCMVNLFITAPARPHLTWVAVYPAMFSLKPVMIYFPIYFLDVSSHLYKRVCPLVGMSVCMLVT